VRATDTEGQARLRDFPTAYVIYFDEQGNQFEQAVEKENRARSSPTLPVMFGDAIRLEGIELSSTQVKRGQAVVAFLDWHVVKKIDQDYSVAVRLIDAKGQVVASYDKEPRRGTAPTSAWNPNSLMTDAVVLPIPNEIVPGNYRLSIGVYDAALKKQLGIDSVIVEPIWIVE